ncbi:undecaprenyl-diphosphate phosphatase [Candidatus Woesearchaeota archaeon]|nr:undecaprenyl-diphosphate phosphatase [Candidatus Woesearchaeota archaeon]
MNEILQAIVLGLIQGITEWLPISSSGHLVLFQHLFNIEQPIIFDIFLHLGSLIVVLIIFWQDIKNLIIGLIKKDKNSIKLTLQLIIATIPIALVGFFLNDLIKSIFKDIRTVGFSLLFTALLLFLSKYPLIKNKSLNYKNTLIIGLLQSLAILPGVSRSGTTISTGLIQGVKGEKAAKFAFLLFIPAILGATILEARNITKITNFTPLIISTIVVVISGYFSLRLLLFIIKKRKFSYFAWYCLILGLVTLTIAYL